MSTTDQIHCIVPFEFTQPWDFELSLNRIKDHALGNGTFLSFAFHVGNSEAERNRWKAAFPALSEQIDATPRFEARPEHGMATVLSLPIEFWEQELKRCADLGLSVMAHPLKRTALSAEDAARLTAAGRGNVLADMVMGEDTSKLGYGYPLEKLLAMQQPRTFEAGAAGEGAGITLPTNVDEITLQTMHDWFLAPFRRDIERLKAMGGVPHLMAIEASAQLHLALAAGCDLPVLELVPHDPVTGIPAVRGAAKAYNSPFWGVHTALSYYQGPANKWTAPRLQIAYNLFYAAGSSLFSEPNIATQIWGLCSAFFSVAASPPQRPGEAECLPFEHPICAAARDVLAEHYRFTQFHRRPSGGPRVPLGVVMGHLDGYVGHEQEHVWCVADPAFAAGPAEATWHHFHRLFEAEHWYTPPQKYYWQADPVKSVFYGTPPCGQVDIVPLAAPLEVLQTYKCLVFLGWNTMTREHYDKLKAYVHGGGRLLMSVPHMSTQLRRDQPLQLIDDGDLSELFGARITGPGARVEEIMHTAASSHEAYQFPVNALYLEEAQLAAVELNGARVLAQPRGANHAVLLEHRYGQGFAWLLTTWDYPGHNLDAFITDLLRTIAEGEQDTIALEGAGVDYAVYDSRTGSGSGNTLATVYLVNKNIYGQPLVPRLLVRGTPIPLRVGGYEMRLAWVLDEELIVAPFNRFVQVDAIERMDGGYVVVVRAEPGVHRIQVALRSGEISRVEMNGVAQDLTLDMEGAASFECPLQTENKLAITTNS